MLGPWLQKAREAGVTEEEKQLYEWNARTLITVWGDRKAANEGGLHDYAHREWSGLLKDFYYPRWKAWFTFLQNRMEGKEQEEIDWFRMEEKWTRRQNNYPVTSQADPVTTALRIYQKVFGTVEE